MLSYLHIQKSSLVLQFFWYGRTRVVQLLEQVVVVMYLLTEFDVIAVHHLLIQRVRFQPITDILGERTVGEENRTAYFV